MVKFRLTFPNIEVGNENFPDDKFTERRFAGWQIGEIHILNNRLKPNARRDGFEQSFNFEKFLEQASLFGRHLSNLCRKSSNSRIAKIRVDGTIQRLYKLFATPVTYIDHDHYQQTLAGARLALSQIEKVASNGLSDELKVKYNFLKSTINSGQHKPIFLENILDGRKLKSFDQKSLLKHVALAVIDSYEKSSSAEDILQNIFSSFTKSSQSFTPDRSKLDLSDLEIKAPPQ